MITEEFIKEFLKERCGCQACRAEEKEPFKCIDCGVNTLNIDEYYMLKKEVWLSIVPGDKGKLCIGCVEKRLGRKLIPDDFLECILNEKGYSEKRSDRLKDRMGFLETMETL